MSNVQADWDNRHFIANIQYNIMKVVTFLNEFGTHTRYPHSLPSLHRSRLPPTRSVNSHPLSTPCPSSVHPAWLCVFSAITDSTTRIRLARLNEKLTRLERQMDYLEAAVQNVAEASAQVQQQ